MLVKLELVEGFEGLDGRFWICVVGFFVVTSGRLVTVVTVGLLVLLIGFLVLGWVVGLVDVVFLGGNLVEGTVLCVVVRTFFVVVEFGVGLRVIEGIGF